MRQDGAGKRRIGIHHLQNLHLGVVLVDVGRCCMSSLPLSLNVEH
jgi:hypothetical protein